MKNQKSVGLPPIRIAKRYFLYNESPEDIAKNKGTRLDTVNYKLREYLSFYNNEEILSEMLKIEQNEKLNINITIEYIQEKRAKLEKYLEETRKLNNVCLRSEDDDDCR